MMNRFQAILPGYPAQGLQKREPLTIWMDQILQALLLAAMAGGWLAFGFSARALGFQSASWTLLPAALLLLALSAVTLRREAPYALRTTALLVALAAASAAAMFNEYGLIAVVLLLAGLLFSVMLLETRHAWFVLIGWLILSAGLAYFSGMWAVWNTPVLIAALPVILPVVAAMLFTMLFLRARVTGSLRAEWQLSQTIEKERAAIETRIQERMAPLQARLMAARAAAEISRHISSIRNADDLLNQVIDLMKERFKLYYIGVFVVDESGRYAVLRAGTGEAGEKMIAQGHRLAIGDSSMIGWAVRHKEPRISQDIKNEAVRFNNPYLPDTRSELALPIVSRGAALGAMTVQAVEENAFDEDDILILSGIAGSLAAALENARLERQAQEMQEEVRTLNRDTVQKAWANTEHSQLQYIFESLTARGATDNSTQYTFPLMLREQVIGEVMLESDADSLTPEETALIEAITTQTAIALESARLLEETQQRAFEEQKLNEMSRQFAQAVQINDILRIAAQELGQLPSAAEVSIHLLAPEIDEPVPALHGNGHKAEQS